MTRKEMGRGKKQEEDEEERAEIPPSSAQYKTVDLFCLGNITLFKNGK